MKILSKENDLYNFIIEKVEKNLVLSDLKIYEYYSKIIFTSIKISLDKLLSDNYIYHCIKIIDLLFWFLVNFTKNIKLTMFLCDRAIILYTEYIVMFLPSSYKDDKIIDIIEVKEFVFKKTIGPIKISKMKKYCVKKNLTHFCQNIKYIYFLLVKEYNNLVDTNILKFMDRYNELNNSIIKIFFNNGVFINKNIDLLNYFIFHYQNHSYIFYNNFIDILLNIYQYNKIEDFNRKKIDKIIELINNQYVSKRISGSEIEKIVNSVKDT